MPRGAPPLRQTTAKIVLVGDQLVGKTDDIDAFAFPDDFGGNHEPGAAIGDLGLMPRRDRSVPKSVPGTDIHSVACGVLAHRLVLYLAAFELRTPEART